MQMKATMSRAGVLGLGIIVLVGSTGCDLLFRGSLSGPLPLFQAADFAGTWDFGAAGNNPLNGFTYGEGDGVMEIDANGVITSSRGSPGNSSLGILQAGRLSFTDVFAGNFGVYVDVPVAGPVEVGTGTMDITKRYLTATFPVNNGTLTAVKR
jgi:hypothetical protein